MTDNCSCHLGTFSNSNTFDMFLTQWCLMVRSGTAVKDVGRSCACMYFASAGSEDCNFETTLLLNTNLLVVRLSYIINQGGFADGRASWPRRHASIPRARPPQIDKSKSQQTRFYIQKRSTSPTQACTAESIANTANIHTCSGHAASKTRNTETILISNIIRSMLPNNFSELRN
jgi:hypothetical protein